MDELLLRIDNRYNSLLVSERIGHNLDEIHLFTAQISYIDWYCFEISDNFIRDFFVTFIVEVQIVVWHSQVATDSFFRQFIY